LFVGRKPIESRPSAPGGFPWQTPTILLARQTQLND